MNRIRALFFGECYDREYCARISSTPQRCSRRCCGSQFGILSSLTRVRFMPTPIELVAIDRRSVSWLRRSSADHAWRHFHSLLPVNFRRAFCRQSLDARSAIMPHSIRSHKLPLTISDRAPVMFNSTSFYSGFGFGFGSLISYSFTLD